MLDTLIHGFNEPEIVHAHVVFSYLESLKMPKILQGGPFVQFSLLGPKKYKTNHRRTLLTSEEEKVNIFHT